MRTLILKLRKDEKGSNLVEWVVIAALIGAVAVGVMGIFGTAMENALDTLGECIESPSATTCTAEPG